MTLAGIPLIHFLRTIGIYIVYQKNCHFLKKKSCLSIFIFHFAKSYALFVNIQECFALA